MRFRLIVLLAVCSNIAAAGPLRHNGARVLRQNVARFLNQTEIPSVPADLIVSTPIAISSSSLISSVAAGPATSEAATTSFTTPATTPSTPGAASSSTTATDVLFMSTPSQSLSTPAAPPSTRITTAVSEHSDMGSGATAVSTSTPIYSGRLFNIGGEPPVDLLSSNNAASFSSTPSPSRASSTISDVQSTFDIQTGAATPSSSLILNHASFSSEAPLTTSSKAAAGQISSSYAIPISTSHPDAASQTTSSVVVPVPISSGLVQILGTAADEFTPVTLDPSLPKPSGSMTYPGAEGGNVAMADGYNYNYKQINQDTPCNPGDPSQAYVCIGGEIAECQSDETYVLKSCPAGQTCLALPKPSGQTGIVVQCIIPSDADSILAGSSSSTTASVAVASQPTPILQAEGDFSQASQSVSAHDPVQPMTSSLATQPTIQSQKIAPSSSLPAVMATFQPIHDSNPLDKNANSEAAPSTSLTTVADATSSISIPTALFAVVTAPNDRVPPSENNAQASISGSQASQPSPEVSTPAQQFSATPPSAATDSSQPTETSVTNTSTSSAESAGITYAPMGVPVNEKAAVGNGQATVTVTVTVTTTERTPPITTIPS